MNSIVEGRIKTHLQMKYHYSPLEAVTIVDHLRELALVAGFELDERFGEAGLGAGPEARVASRLVEQALGTGGSETSEWEVTREIERWLRTRPLRA